MNTLGDRIKQLRKDSKLTQKELGDKLNVGKSTISQYENNINTPDIDTLKKISKIFDVPVDYLLGNTNIKNISMNSIFSGVGGLTSLIDVLQLNSASFPSENEKEAGTIMLSIINTLIDTGALTEDNFNEDTLNIIKSALNMYIKSRKRSTDK